MKPGLYILLWKEGGHSLAAVGHFHDGSAWYAPINWTVKNKCGCGLVGTDWRMVSGYIPLNVGAVPADVVQVDPKDVGSASDVGVKGF